MTEIVAADIGGTHARFALFDIVAGKIVRQNEAVKLRTADYASLQTAWEAFADAIGRGLPDAAGFAVAMPVGGDVLKFTNNPWVIRPALIGERLKVARYTLINDFAAVGHAVAHLDATCFRHVCGPDRAISHDETVSIIGPGTGLGVSQLVMSNGQYRVIPTEGGHVDFAPLDALEDRILLMLRTQYRRVSIERIVSGQGLATIYRALAELEGRPASALDDQSLWALALDGQDSLANAALDRFCLTLGAVAGDIALAQGSTSVVLAGGLGLRIADHLPRSGFAERFKAKGRFESRMASIPVRLLIHPDPGLFGAAAAFAQEHLDDVRRP